MSVLEMLEGLSHDTGGEVAWVIIALISNLSEGRLSRVKLVIR